MTHKKIKVRIKVKGKDNFFLFPTNLKTAFNLMGVKRGDILKITKFENLKFITFKNTSDYIEIRD